MLSRCPKCHYPTNHPLGLIVSEQECSGCLTHKEKDEIDWSVKAFELEMILSKYKKQHNKYDCVVPVIGDAEDFYTLSKVLELGLSPLVVCVNDYFKNDIGWKNLHQLITHFDVDSLIYNPDMRVYKELIRTSLRKFDHMMLPFLQLHTSFPVHVAYERKIPLVVWGQNQSVEQTGKFSHHDAAEMSRWSRRENDLFNIEIDTLIGNGAQVDERGLNYYEYPNIQSLSRRGVRGIYLSNYMRWDPLAQNHAMVQHGFTPEVNLSTFDIYERAGSSVYYTLHDLLKFKRCGYRKISDHVAREIRHGRIQKNEGLQLIKLYENKKVYIKDFFDWLGVSQTGYEWYIKHKLYGLEFLISESKNEIKQNNNYNFFKDKSHFPKINYIAFGKGLYI